MAFLLRTALVIVLCLAVIGCGGGSKKTLGERIQGSDSYQKQSEDVEKKYRNMVEAAARKREGICGDQSDAPGPLGLWREDPVFRVHGIECRTARRLLNNYFFEDNKAPGGYTCRSLIFCWRGTSAANAKHAPHWFRLSAK